MKRGSGTFASDDYWCVIDDVRAFEATWVPSVEKAEANGIRARRVSNPCLLKSVVHPPAVRDQTAELDSKRAQAIGEGAAQVRQDAQRASS